MDRLWSPWRYTYISKNEPAGGTKGQSGSGCFFCDKSAANNDAENLIVYRGQLNFILLNLYPYTSGHVMVAPYKHVASLIDADDDILAEMMLLTRATETHLRAIYHPDGLNIGMNIGNAAGAGVPDHIHMHVLPRWTGDANFMTTVGETRVLPEDLTETYRRLSAAFQGLNPDQR